MDGKKRKILKYLALHTDYNTKLVTWLHAHYNTATIFIKLKKKTIAQLTYTVQDSSANQGGDKVIGRNRNENTTMLSFTHRL